MWPGLWPSKWFQKLRPLRLLSQVPSYTQAWGQARYRDDTEDQAETGAAPSRSSPATQGNSNQQWRTLCKELIIEPHGSTERVCCRGPAPALGRPFCAVQDFVSLKEPLLGTRDSTQCGLPHTSPDSEPNQTPGPRSKRQWQKPGHFPQRNG